LRKQRRRQLNNNEKHNVNVHLREISTEELKSVEAAADFWCLVDFCSPKYLGFS
jgi:hypothetical protein